MIKDGKGHWIWPSDDELIDIVVKSGSVRSAARALRVDHSTLLGRIRRVDLEDAIEEARLALQMEGIDTGDLSVTGVTINEKDDPAKSSVQIKVRSVPKWASLMPARDPGWIAPKAKPVKQTPILAAIFSDHQCPFFDKNLHAATCQWLERNKPTYGFINGDTVDFDTFSKYLKNPKWTAEAQHCLDSSYGLVKDYVQAAGSGTIWEWLEGNHDARLPKAILQHLVGAFGIRRAQTPDEKEKNDPVLSIPYLLRFDELGIKHRPMDGGDYNEDQAKVTDKLAVRHGWVATKGSGSSALKTIDHLRYSAIMGHTHRQSMVFHTAWDIDDNPNVSVGAETGAMCEIKGGLGHTVAPDWQQGFATAWIWPDGKFKISLAQYVAGALLWEDQRIDASV